MSDNLRAGGVTPPSPPRIPKTIIILETDGHSVVLQNSTTEQVIFVSVTEHRIEIGDNQTEPVFVVYNDKSILGLATENDGSIAYPVNNMYGFTETTNLYIVWDTSDNITDLTGTTWLLNEEPTLSQADYYINFTSNSTSFVGWSDNGGILRYVQYDGSSYSPVVAYGKSNTNFPGWQDNNYKTITITGGDDVTNSDLISWLQANATQQITPTPTETKNIWSGLNQIAKAFWGSSKVNKIYLGSTLIYGSS